VAANAGGVVHNVMPDEVEARMRRDHGLTLARYDVLSGLDGAGGELGLGDLATSIVLSPSGLSKLLDQMEAFDLIRRRPVPDDGRATFATITLKGRSLVREAHSSHLQVLQQLIGDALDDRGIADLVRIMGRLTESVAPQRRP
jgi:DNA-binding MarR family transcriptional regulator